MMVSIGLGLIMLAWLFQVLAPVKKKTILVSANFALFYAAGAFILAMLNAFALEYVNGLMNGFCAAFAFVVWLRLQK